MPLSSHSAHRGARSSQLLCIPSPSPELCVCSRSCACFLPISRQASLHVDPVLTGSSFSLSHIPVLPPQDCLDLTVSESPVVLGHGAKWLPLCSVGLLSFSKEPSF